MYGVPLNESNPDLRVDFLEYNEYDADGKRLKHFTWITDLHITLRNAWLFARGGRARWRIENETFNTLKNQGYHYEHNYGHGRRNLSVVFAMLMMLAFLVDQVQQLCCPLFRAVWKKLGSKRALWDNLRSHFRHFRIPLDAATLRSHPVRSCQRGAAPWAGQLLTLLLRSRQRRHTLGEAFPRPTLTVFRRRFPAHARPRPGKTPLSLPSHVILRPSHTRQVSSASTQSALTATRHAPSAASIQNQYLRRELLERSNDEWHDSTAGIIGKLCGAVGGQRSAGAGLAAVARRQPRRQGDRVHRPQDLAQGTDPEVEGHRGRRRTPRPALVGDKLYVFAPTGRNEVIRCLDAANGKELWQDKYATQGASGAASPHRGPRSSPTVADGKVVTLGVGGVLSCVDAANGKLLWRKDDFSGAWPRFYTSCSPIVVDGLCIAQLGGESDGGDRRLRPGHRQPRSGSGPATARPTPRRCC